MSSGNHLQSNIDRFSGYENDYDQHRPKAPSVVVDILTNYIGHKPSLIVDVGCGTGLSTFAWDGHAERVMGFEPNDDMRGKALKHLVELQDAKHFSFEKGYSDQLALESGIVDIVTCSQSFHWMEPVSTLHEFARVLRKGGIFAAYDCDWPPTVYWEIEEAYMQLIEKSDQIIARHVEEKDRAIKRDKEQHLKQIRESGLFRFSKEIVFHNMEACDAQRYVGLALSQGGVQSVFKLRSNELDERIKDFRSSVEQYFAGRTLNMMFSYRMRLGVK
ncbi:ubiquinone/menaquinone biosynthesis C-methylase UbiE [Paenibacillus castaneae]|uniref:class I SAM-dependent methyltransferase n=1 Tax=Paenibacillus castaneae TaxID=474957 RepID=UPI000C9A6945|nr:class I SAM-dependent methyltransferase [Paenibacillus castaneae]NIK78232.1 ubiquinone/menaquinone biosynthesis C-methylase UbiE [Paenibacillus castaneae]